MARSLTALAFLGFFFRVFTYADEAPDCSLWLAPSLLSSEQKPVFGLFAGSQGFAEDEVIPSYEIAVPVFDFLRSPAAQRSDLNRAVVEFVDSNMWTADFAGSQLEGNHSQSVFIPGIGALSNYHSGISNVDWLQGSLLLRGLDEHMQAHTGMAHPSRGAITHYYNATMRATKTIQPGMELFAQYGDTWDNNDNTYHDKVTRGDYEKADKVIDEILKFMDIYGAQMSDKLKDDVLDFMLETVLEGADGKNAKVVRSLIPAHPGKLQRVKDAGGSFAYRNRDMIKSMDWLKKHGQCVDNLRVGRSTIPDAGRGAFAKRAIKLGFTISPVPMLPLQNEEVLELYNETKEEDGEMGKKEYVLDDSKPPSGYQLLLNYCFGHPESTLLLLPMAPMVNLINHASDETKVNAFLQWSKHDHVFNDHHLHDVPVQDWDTTSIPPMIMELVATRDIQEGEEILIDYGVDWEEAWQKFKQEWENKYLHSGTNAKWPLHALDLRPVYKKKPFPVDIKPGQAPYPQGVLTACFIQNVDDLPDGQPRKNSAGLQITRWLSPTTFQEYLGKNLVVCDLNDRKEVSDGAGALSYNYTVMTRLKDSTVDKLIEVRDVPQSAITLVDRPYTSEIHTPSAFRRWISMEDQRFPQAWRNLRN